MIDFKLDMRSYNDLFTKLDVLGKKTATKVMKKALRDAAKIQRKATKGNIASMFKKRSGDLFRSVIVRAAKTKQRGVFGIRVMLDTRKYPNLVKFTKDGTRHFYPAVLEYGSRFVTGRHFMRRAFESSAGAMKAKIVEITKAGIEAAAKRKAG